MDWKNESEMFDQTAEYYDTFRPSYPMEIIDKIISITNVNDHSKLLEIGAGSGKATTLFKPYNLNIFCVDPGENLVKNGIKFSKFDSLKLIVLKNLTYFLNSMIQFFLHKHFIGYHNL